MLDINQASQMITWLDEEHRRDRTMLVELRQRVEAQAAEIVDQAKRIQELEGRLVSTQARLTRFNTLEQAIQAMKEDLVQMVQEQDQEFTRFQRELGKSRQIEQESVARSINEVKRSLDAIPPLHDRFTMFKTEDQRLSEAILHLQTRVTAHERQTSQLPDRITYVEGQRAQDVKAVAQLQQEALELLRRTEHLSNKLEVLDDIARKSEQRIAAVASFRDELVKRQAAVTEELRLREAQRDRQMQEWQAELVRFDDEMAQQRKVMERFGREQEEAQQYLVGIDDYKEALNREQRQVTEHQRLSEERQRRELEEWVAANEQRWTKFRLERDARWQHQTGRNEEAVNRLKQLEALRVADGERLQKMARDMALIEEEVTARLRELWTVWDRAAVVQLDQARRWYDEMSAAVAERVDER